MKKKKVLKSSNNYVRLVVIAIAVLGLIVVGKTLASSLDLNVLGAHTLLAKGGDDSGGDSRGGGSNSGSGSSGGSNSGSSGGRSSSSGGSNSGSGSNSGGSGSSGSGSSGGGSSTANVSENTKVLCTGPDGKQFETKLRDCQELNNAWHNPVNFKTLPNSLSPVVPRAPEVENEVEREHAVVSPTGIALETGVNTGITKIQLQENKSRVEQIIFENGLKKKIEMRNDNGRIRIRVKTEDPVTGAETDQLLELKPEDGIARLKVEANGVEQSVKVKAQNNMFVIEQEGLAASGVGTQSATINLPLTIDPVTNSIAVTTKLGTIKVLQLPATAIKAALARNTLNTVISTELGESEKSTIDPNQQVVYRITGIKNTKFLGLFKVDAPIITEVSAITGQLTFVKQPWYLNAFGFLFAK